MVGTGGRVPNGGCAGSGYTAYSHMSTDSNHDIDVIFTHGYVSYLLAL